MRFFFTRDPDNVTAGWFLALCSYYGGHPEQISRSFPDSVLGQAVSAPEIHWAQAGSLILGGEPDRARVLIDRVVSGSGDDYVDPDRIWPIYATLGEIDQAIFWMERSIEDQSSAARYIGVNPQADPLRDDPRYQALLDRIGLGYLKARFDSLAAARPSGGM